MFQIRRYYFTHLWQMQSGSFLCLSIICFIGQANYILSRPFSFTSFFPSLALMVVMFFCAYQFFKSLLAPTLQVFEHEIVLTRVLRRNIKMADVEEFSVKGGRVFLKYKWKGEKVTYTFDVREA